MVSHRKVAIGNSGFFCQFLAACYYHIIAGGCYDYKSISRRNIHCHNPNTIST